MNCMNGNNPANGEAMILMDPENSFKHQSTILNSIPGQSYIYKYSLVFLNIFFINCSQYFIYKFISFLLVIEKLLLTNMYHCSAHIEL